MPLARLRAFRFALPLLLLLPLGGCFQLRALLRLAADGSGTLEETVALGNGVRAFLSMADTTGGPLVIYDVDSLRAHAAELGRGVRFVRVDTFADGEHFGYRALYAFDDVGAVRFRFSRHPIMLPGQGAQSNDNASDNTFFAGTSDALPITFAFAPGRLTVRMPQPASSGGAAELDPDSVAAATAAIRTQMTQGGGAMARQMMGDARYGVTVALPGRVTTTTAAHAADSTLTLVDLAFGALFDVMAEKPELVARAQLLEKQGTPDPRPVLRAVAARPGVRYELQPEVTVEWE